jgi:porphyrinogen peroxidase
MQASPQAGIFAEGSQFYLALEYRCTATAELRAALRRARDAVRANKEAYAVFAFGNHLLRAFGSGGIQDFAPINGADGKKVPATQNDLLIWLHGARPDINFDLAHALHAILEDHAQLVLEVPGFNYHTNRDMTGFIDGTANPQGMEAPEVALVPSGQAGAGGAYVMSIQFLHDLDAFQKLPVPEQEKIFGRRRDDSTELEGAAKPADAHIARAEVSIDGEEQKIYRRSFPFGGVQRHGLYFIAFAREQRRFDVILKSMFGISGDGVHDRLLNFTRAVTGSYWFAPSNEALDKMLG